MTKLITSSYRNIYSYNGMTIRTHDNISIDYIFNDISELLHFQMPKEENYPSISVETKHTRNKVRCKQKRYGKHKAWPRHIV